VLDVGRGVIVVVVAVPGPVFENARCGARTARRTRFFFDYYDTTTAADLHDDIIIFVRLGNTTRTHAHARGASHAQHTHTQTRTRKEAHAHAHLKTDSEPVR